MPFKATQPLTLTLTRTLTTTPALTPIPNPNPNPNPKPCACLPVACRPCYAHPKLSRLRSLLLITLTLTLSLCITPTLSLTPTLTLTLSFTLTLSSQAASHSTKGLCSHLQVCRAMLRPISVLAPAEPPCMPLRRSDRGVHLGC